MAEVVIPVDAEQAAVAYLRACYTDRDETATVSTKVRRDRPTRYVRISLADTIEQTPLHSYARLIFECYAVDEVAASALARTAYALMRAAEGDEAGGEWVADVQTVSGPANNPDETGPCYQFTLDLLLAGEVI